MIQRIIISLIIFFVFFGFGYSYISNSPPQGDELHYLITAQSIVKDHDIWLENNYQNLKIDKHTVIGPDGHEYLYHGLGLFPLTIAVPFSILGRLGVMITLCIATVFLFWQIFNFTKEVTENSKLSALISLVIIFSLPLANYSFLIFPEIVGALLIIFNLRSFLKSKGNLFVFISLGLMPWVHIRLLPVSLTFLLLWGFKLHFQKQKKLLILLPSILLIASYFLFLHTIYGSIVPTKPYSNLGIQTDTGSIPVNLINILIDRQYGLLPFTPIFLLALPGLVLWFRKQPKLVLIVYTITATYLLPTLRYSDWHGGFSPPGRYLVMILPLFIPAIVFCLLEKRLILTKIIALSLGLWGVLAFIINLGLSPNHGFIYQDGTSPFFRFLSSNLGINFHDLMPAFYPQQSLGLAHITWLLIFILFCSFMLVVNKNESKKN